MRQYSAFSLHCPAENQCPFDSLVSAIFFFLHFCAFLLVNPLFKLALKHSAEVSRYVEKLCSNIATVGKRVG